MRALIDDARTLAAEMQEEGGTGARRHPTARLRPLLPEQCFVDAGLVRQALPRRTRSLMCEVCGGTGFVYRADIEAGRATWNDEAVACPICYLNHLTGATA
jgi:hypothetical protein